MKERILARCAGLLGMALVALALASCGGKKEARAGVTSGADAASGGSVTQSTGNSASSSGTNSGASTPVRSVSYRATLSGPDPHAPVYGPRHGRPTGSGTAFISIRAASNELCWEFEHLKNMIAPPNEAELAGKVHGVGITSTPLSDEHNRYVASGCASEPLWLVETIEQQPHSFEVVIRNRKYLERALRGRI